MSARHRRAARRARKQALRRVLSQFARQCGVPVGALREAVASSLRSISFPVAWSRDDAYLARRAAVLRVMLAKARASRWSGIVHIASTSRGQIGDDSGAASGT